MTDPLQPQSASTAESPASISGVDDGRHMPRLSIAEWVTFGVLAALLAVTNIYTVLLTGWGEGGSIIAVLGAVLILSWLGSREPTIATLNLAQTMASAGGSVGFAVATYAAVKMVDPEFNPSLPTLTAMFVGMGMLGTMVGASVRRYMTRYFFPSGTACAVIQRTVTQASSREGRRPIRLLALWGGVASLLTIPTKITLSKGGHALIGVVPIGSRLGLDGRVALGVEPLLYGIGIIVGPRIGVGMLIGGLAAPYLIEPWLRSAGITEPSIWVEWGRWSAIAVLTIPTFATILFAYVFRQEAVVPPGFEPGKVQYRAPARRSLIYAAVGVVALLLTAVTGQLLFELPFVVTVLTVIISWPLCIMNGRVTGDTDINPVRLVAIVLLTLFAFVLAGNAVTLLGMAIIGGTMAGMAVDMMQDYRTGFLVNANPAHQTSVQFVGVLVGALVAVPFFALIEASMGFGAGTALPAPGAQVWATMARAFSGEALLTSGMIWAVIIISLAGSGYAFFTVWPRTAAWMPSIFGVGIGLLLPLAMSAAIFAGGMIKLAVTVAYKRRAPDQPGKAAAANDAANDTMLVGAAIFAASAICSVLIVVLTELMGWQGIEWFFMAGH